MKSKATLVFGRLIHRVYKHSTCRCHDYSVLCCMSTSTILSCMYIFLYHLPTGGVQEASVYPGQPQDQPVADVGREADEAEPSHPVGPGC